MASVKSCPTTKDTYLEASRRLGCVNDTYHHNQYICLSNTEKTSLVEFCNNDIMGIQEKGSCLEASVGKLIRHSCQNFSMGCPENDFWEYEYYKYPACQFINTKDHCYVMDPSCPTNDHTKETNNHATIIFACSVIVGLLVVLIIAAVFSIRKGTNQGYRRSKNSPDKGPTHGIEDDKTGMLCRDASCLEISRIRISENISPESTKKPGRRSDPLQLSEKQLEELTKRVLEDPLQLSEKQLEELTKRVLEEIAGKKDLKDSPLAIVGKKDLKDSLPGNDLENDSDKMKLL